MAKKRAPAPAVQLLRPPQPTGIGVFCLTSRGKELFYAFAEVPCAIGGRGFAVYRVDVGQLYHVRVGQPDEYSCECLGFSKHNTCKHVRAISALLALGSL